MNLENSKRLFEQLSEEQNILISKSKNEMDIEKLKGLEIELDKINGVMKPLLKLINFYKVKK